LARYRLETALAARPPEKERFDACSAQRVDYAPALNGAR
jgi:hypothetical protein